MALHELIRKLGEAHAFTFALDALLHRVLREHVVDGRIRETKRETERQTPHQALSSATYRITRHREPVGHHFPRKRGALFRQATLQRSRGQTERSRRRGHRLLHADRVKTRVQLDQQWRNARVLRDEPLDLRARLIIETEPGGRLAERQEVTRRVRRVEHRVETCHDGANQSFRPYQRQRGDALLQHPVVRAHVPLQHLERGAIDALDVAYVDEGAMRPRVWPKSTSSARVSFSVSARPGRPHNAKPKSEGSGQKVTKQRPVKKRPCGAASQSSSVRARVRWEGGMRPPERYCLGSTRFDEISMPGRSLSRAVR